MILVAGHVEQEPRRSRIVADDDVLVSVVVDVAERGAAANLGDLERRAASGADILEAAIGEIAKQQPALFERKRSARLAVGGLHASVDGEDIEPAVVVDVDPRRPESGKGERKRSERRPRAVIVEDALPAVHVEVAAFAVQFGHDQVIIAVVVEVTGIDAHARL